MRKYSYLCSLLSESIKDEGNGQTYDSLTEYLHCYGLAEQCLFLAEGNPV
jgi:hypothetical protein